MGLIRNLKHELGISCKYLGSEFCDCSYPDCFKRAKEYYGEEDAGCIRQARERESKLDGLAS